MPRQRLGDRGEELAAQFLVRGGWRILHRNYRAGRNEIDLVARRGGVVAFIEVKARSGFGYGHPLEAITERKRAEIERVASDWIARHGDGAEAYRFDAVTIIATAGSPPIVEHIEDAWGY